GFEQKLQVQPLRFLYEKRYGRLPDAYEQVLVDAIRSKRSLFASSQEVLASWRILQPILDFWKTDNQLVIYDPGSTIEQVLGAKHRGAGPESLVYKKIVYNGRDDKANY